MTPPGKAEAGTPLGGTSRLQPPSAKGKAKRSPREQAIKKVLRAIERWPTNHPSIAHLAAATKLSERTVQRYLRDAEDAGLVKISYSVGRGLANSYFVPEKVTRKGASCHPIRRGTSYLSNYVRQVDVLDEGKSTTTAVVVGPTSLDEPPWWMTEVRLPKRGSEEWPRDAEGRRLALLDGTTEVTRCQACGQPIRRREPGTNRVLPPSGVLVEDWNGTGKMAPVHMAGRCAGGRPGQSYTTVGDIARKRS